MKETGRLLFSNVPMDCDEEYLREWIEARGYRTLRVRLIRDWVSCTSPSFAHVELMDSSRMCEAERTLDGQTFCGVNIQVEQFRLKAVGAA